MAWHRSSSSRVHTVHTNSNSKPKSLAGFLKRRKTLDDIGDDISDSIGDEWSDHLQNEIANVETSLRIIESMDSECGSDHLPSIASEDTKTGDDHTLSQAAELVKAELELEMIVLESLRMDVDDMLNDDDDCSWMSEESEEGYFDFVVSGISNCDFVSGIYDNVNESIISWAFKDTTKKKVGEARGERRINPSNYNIDDLF